MTLWAGWARTWRPALAFSLLLVAPRIVGAAQRYAFTTLEGSVVAVAQYQGEGSLQVLALDVAPDRRPSEPVRVLLGPPAACEEIGFEVEAGDRIRARVFVGLEGEPVKAQKVLNLSRGLMVRFRTMHDVPLWDAAGAWQGGPGRAWHGMHGGDHAGGPGSPGRRPGGGMR